MYSRCIAVITPDPAFPTASFCRIHHNLHLLQHNTLTAHPPTPFFSTPPIQSRVPIAMPPKNKNKAPASDSKDSKGKGGGASGSSGKLKPATSINVRHILCEKHSKKEEAVTKLREGAKFDDVARTMSEDKARQGTFIRLYLRGWMRGDRGFGW